MVLRRTIVAMAVLALALALDLVGSPAQAAAAKDPVIVVAGYTGGPLAQPLYTPMVDRLRRDGYHVDLLLYPDYGIGAIRTHAARLRDLVAGVKARTRASKVDVVAHSMGGLVTREYLRSMGGTAHVDSLIMLGTPNHGTTLADVSVLLSGGSCWGSTACLQMTTTSTYLAGLNAGDDTLGAVRYTAIGTRQDQIVTPYTSVFLADDGSIANLTLQDQCPSVWSEHFGLAFNPVVYDGVRDALRGEPVRFDCSAR